MPAPESGEIPVYVRSAYGANGHRSIVHFVIGERRADLTPGKAREIAGMLLEAAEAADGAADP